MRYLFLLLTLACSCQAITDSGRTPTQSTGQPAIRFRGFEFRSNTELRFAVFDLVNPTADEYTYHHHLGPVFSSFDLGNPRPFEGVGFCGTGTTKRSLRPGDAVPLRAWIDGAVGPIQVRMDVRDRSGTTIQLVSAAVDITEGEARAR